MRNVSLALGGAAADIEAAAEAAAPARLRAAVNTEYDFLWRSLRRLGVPEGDVDDAVQKVFLVFARRLSDVKEGCERSFLYQSALRIAAEGRRTTRRRREVYGTDQDETEDERPGPDALMDQRRARAALDAALDALRLDLRAVFTLFELDQMTLTEIAELLGVPRGTVASRLRLARVELRAKLGDLMRDRGEGTDP